MQNFRFPDIENIQSQTLKHRNDISRNNINENAPIYIGADRGILEQDPSILLSQEKDKNRWNTGSVIKYVLRVLFYFFLACGVFIGMGYSIADFEKNCPDCICTVAPITTESSIVKINTMNEKTDAVHHLTKKIFENDKRMANCVNSCWDNFNTCSMKLQKEKCMKETKIPLTCEDFNLCLSECNMYCSSSNYIVNPGSEAECVTKHSKDFICMDHNNE